MRSENQKTKSIFVISRVKCTNTVKGVAKIHKKFLNIPCYCENRTRKAQTRLERSGKTGIDSKIRKKSLKHPSAREGDVMAVPASPKRGNTMLARQPYKAKNEKDRKIV